MQIDGTISGWDNTRKSQELQTELGNGSTASVDESDNTKINVSYKGYNIIINTEDETITIEKNPITIAEFKIEGIPVEEADIPVPTGFTHTIGTKDSGYVIESNTTGDQFVWVPVDKNQKITIKVNSEETITEMKLYDPYGDEINLGTVNGNTYENANITPSVNGGYYLKIATASGSKTATLNVHSLYAKDTWSDYWGSDEGIERLLDLWREEVFWDEGSLEDMISDKGYSSIEEYKIKIRSGVIRRAEPEDTIDYVGKVALNGGFYVGRYEASYSSNNALSKPSTSTRTSTSTSLTEGMLWNYIYYSDALDTAKAYNATLNSSLLTESAWGRILGWLYETENKTGSQIAGDSKDWGNYQNDEFSGTTGLINTGAFEQTIANNIYDLAGNVEEWTIASFSTNMAFAGNSHCRGDNGSSATQRGVYGMSDATGFRLALYL